jgi:hypothetical protein
MLSGIGNPLSIQVKDGYYIKATIESNINYELEDYYSYNKSACLTIPYDDDTPDADQNQRTLSSGEKQQKFNIGGFANKMPTSSLDDWIKILAYQKDKASVLIGQLYGTIDVTMQAYVYTFSMSDIIDIVKIDGTPLESSKVQDFFNQNPDLSFSYQPSALTTITNPEANNFLTIFNENAEFKSDTFKIPSTVTSGYTGTYASPDDLVYPYSFQLNIFDQNNLL